ncbi:MAG: TetR/AcrR family transcriptional regulator [Bacillota bacterium]|jgi:AcrR family transcriptional regulator
MNGHERRALKKETQIKQSALELFNKYGVLRVSIDEIAAYANVSKVTIYKYFHSKDGLHRAVVQMIFDETIAALQQILNSDRPFLEKLNRLITAKEHSRQYLRGDFLGELIKNDRYLEDSFAKDYQNKVKNLVFTFLDQGKIEGYIDNSMSNETIYLYMEIFKAGMKEKRAVLQTALLDNQVFEKLVKLFFFGFITPKKER